MTKADRSFLKSLWLGAEEVYVGVHQCPELDEHNLLSRETPIKGLDPYPLLRLGKVILKVRKDVRFGPRAGTWRIMTEKASGDILEIRFCPFCGTKLT